MRHAGWMGMGALALLMGGSVKGFADDNDTSPRASDTTRTGTTGTIPGRTGDTTGMRGQSKDDNERDVLNKLHEANQNEIAFGKLAQDKCQSAACKSYGKMLVKDHQAADEKVTTLAKKDGVEVTSAAIKQDEIDKLAAERATFDQKFGAKMADEHDKAISMVKDAQKNASAGEFRTLLTSLLPKLEHHKTTAQQLAKGEARTMGRRSPSRNR